jgi:hypothetical protein
MVGHEAGARTFKVHIDVLNMLPYLHDPVSCARHALAGHSFHHAAV